MLFTLIVLRKFSRVDCFKTMYLLLYAR